MKITKVSGKINGNTIATSKVIDCENSKFVYKQSPNSNYQGLSDNDLENYIKSRTKQAESLMHKTFKDMKEENIQDRLKKWHFIGKSIKNQSLQTKIVSDNELKINNDFFNSELVEIVKDPSKIDNLNSRIDELFVGSFDDKKISNDIGAKIFLDCQPNNEDKNSGNYRQSLQIKIKEFMDEKRTNLEFEKEKEEDRERDRELILIGYNFILDMIKNSKNRKGYIPREKVTNLYLMSHIHGKLRNIITQKMLQTGKSIYHFYDFDDSKFKTTNPTSFDYDMIKANESITKAIYCCLSSANLSLANSIENYNTGNFAQWGLFDWQIKILKNIKDKADNEKKTIEFLKQNFDGINENQQNGIVNQNTPTTQNNCSQFDRDLKQFERFFGGEKDFNIYLDSKKIEHAKFETKFNFYTLLKSLEGLRNSTFHYDRQSYGNIDENVRDFFSQYEQENYKTALFLKYKNHKVCNYYELGDIEKVIKNPSVNGENDLTVPIGCAYIPSFKRINLTSKGELFEIPKTTDKQKIEGALARKFLAIQIYYGEFLGRSNIAYEIKQHIKKLPHSTKGLSNQEIKSIPNLLDNKAIFDIVENKFTLEDICTSLQREFVDANSDDKKNQNDSKKIKSDNLNIILRIAVQEVFEEYIDKNYHFLNDDAKPRQTDSEADYKELENFIEGLNIPLKINDHLPFYALAKFIPPLNLSRLVNEFRKYDIFVKDIKSIANSLNNGNLTVEPYYNSTDIQEILSILIICQESSGRISSNIEDYYDDETKYAEELKEFIHFDEKTLAKNFRTPKDFKNFFGDFIASDQKFTPLAQIEQAKMFGFSEKCNAIYMDNLITRQDIAKLKSLETECENLEKTLSDQEKALKLKEYEQIKNKVQLNWISRTSDILMDIYSFMVSYCYMFERDTTYFTCAVDYLEKIESNEPKLSTKINLSDASKVFKYDNDHRVYNKRLTNFITNHKKTQLYNDLFQCEFPNKENKQQMKKPINNQSSAVNTQNNNSPFTARNSIDHFDFLSANRVDKKIMSYYSDVYDLISYDKKLKNSAYPKITKYLESKNIRATFKFSFNKDKKNKSIIEFDKFETFKTGEKNTNSESKIKVPIYSEEFIMALKNILSVD